MAFHFHNFQKFTKKTYTLKAMVTLYTSSLENIQVPNLNADLFNKTPHSAYKECTLPFAYICRVILKHAMLSWE